MLRKITSRCNGHTKALNLKKQFLRSREKQNFSPHFHYFLFRQDKTLFADLTDILYSISSLKDILDINGCKKFLDAFDEGKLSDKEL